jgi:hypothetical protein
LPINIWLLDHLVTTVIKSLAASVSGFVGCLSLIP